jgi:glycosyltransferase involved in cell wall biosynthesis
MAEHARHLLVDARPIEHPTARNRGIGRYTTGILQGLVEVGVPVTALAADSAQADLIRPQVPNVDVAVWSPSVVRAHATTGAWYLATGLFLHPNSFDPVPATITRAGLPVAGIMYDVIPYRYPERYLADPSARRMAELRKPLARTVDVVLAISEFAATTSIAELGLAPERVRSIGAGVESRFTATRRGTVRPQSVPAQEYVVCVTGTDEHKNTAGLIEAWGHLPRSVRTTYRLVIIGRTSDAVRARWERDIERAGCSDSIGLAGGVTDEHLVELLQHAALSVTPSFEEGFGLPVLEAAACGCPVITSDRGALPEVLDEPSSRFDPDDHAAIAAAIEQALLDDHHRNLLLAAASRAAARWTWPYVAINALDAIEAIAPAMVNVTRPAGGTPRAPAVLLVYGADMAPVGEQVAAAIGELPGSPEVWQAVHVAGTDQSSRPTAHRSPAGAVGRYPKVHEFDQVVVLGDATVPTAVSAALRLLPPFDVAPVAALLPAG